MSEWSFNANIHAEASSVVQDLEVLTGLLRSPQKNAQVIRDLLGFDAVLLPAVTLDLGASDGAVTLTGELSGAVPLAFFEMLVDYIDTLSDGQFHARLFDSSSGGVVSWGLDDLPDIEGKVITFIGDFQEELDELIELAKAAASAGAKFIQVSPPFYFSHTEDDFFEYIVAAADSADIGIIIYNTFWTSLQVSEELIDRLADIPQVVGLKWSVPDTDWASFESSISKYSSRFSIIDNQLRFVTSHMLAESRCIPATIGPSGASECGKCSRIKAMWKHRLKL